MTNWKHQRALEVIASLNANNQGLEDARRIALKALEPQPELRIVCAANRYNEHIVVCGARHYDLVMHSVIGLLREDERHIEQQGFIDNKGTWHDRWDALVIARAAGQIVGKKHHPLDQLFSEEATERFKQRCKDRGLELREVTFKEALAGAGEGFKKSIRYLRTAMRNRHEVH